MPNGNGPFSENDLLELNKRLDELTEAEQVIERAKMADIDIGDRDKQAMELRTRLIKLKQAFFPGR